MILLKLLIPFAVPAIPFPPRDKLFTVFRPRLEVILPYSGSRALALQMLYVI